MKLASINIYFTRAFINDEIKSNAAFSVVFDQPQSAKTKNDAMRVSLQINK